jgi:histone deacetylase complex regulatory component SIN3
MLHFLNMDSFALYFQVTDILQRCPDLMNGFSEFLEHCENIGRQHILIHLRISVC